MSVFPLWGHNLHTLWGPKLTQIWSCGVQGKKSTFWGPLVLYCPKKEFGNNAQT